MSRWASDQNDAQREARAWHAVHALASTMTTKIIVSWRESLIGLFCHSVSVEYHLIHSSFVSDRRVAGGSRLNARCQPRFSSLPVGSSKPIRKGTIILPRYTKHPTEHRPSYFILKIPSQLVCAIDVIAAGLGLYGYPWTETMSSSTLQSDGHAHPDIHPHSHSHCHGHSFGHDHGHGQDTWSGEEYLARPGV